MKDGSPKKKDTLPRTVLPIPDVKPIGFTTYDAKDPETKFPPIRDLRPPEGAPNVLIVLIDDAGFGSSSAFGGPCHTPNTAQFGKCHEVPVWQSSPVGPFNAWPTGGGGFEYFYGFIGGEANQWYPSLY